ncbi:MAG: inositol-3-phosphate synthase [Candidatus Omnitrophica bacterium CG11_big_fil_rev_8_21_14_0_20_45_26]|uniref:Inositol-3-phosphate synthase n=1 Tax=Candidatus Abzuiibacterium crystallinum TaxID=1974748 RepID=A0A2H0LLX9_9BACT|nr:MAG: inositol-3-phosphate synthase [Candidatus Omnitrophica bacterium CG11_big_fil_rev_8_21_14_0_20_45_26]PIW63466.1 MAG: inositol-3-phosphate synthase [Candidatus Omnitrophica bacterium CG12_big_fil_rev_8_21_14_0_65_45_16]
MSKIKIGIVGVGNCASSLIQGMLYHGNHQASEGPQNGNGLMHAVLGGFTPSDIEPVVAFDIDARKVGNSLHEAIFAAPNCTMRLVEGVAASPVIVEMGNPLDGMAEHMKDYPSSQRFVLSSQKPSSLSKVVSRLKETGTEILINYLPVGSEKATRFYAEACLKAGVSFLNCMPVFIASDPVWNRRFEEKGIPIVGDDVKSQAGATITHRVLTRLFEERGVTIDRTYQLNTGGNTDFLNMLNRERLHSKKISKTEAVQSEMQTRLPDENIHIGPSDYVPWQKDNKVCYIRIEGRGFAGAPVTVELRLSVEDSPNSAGVVIDAIRCLKLARLQRLAGTLQGVSAYYMKHPLIQMSDTEAREEVELFIKNFDSDLPDPDECLEPKAGQKTAVPTAV